MHEVHQLSYVHEAMYTYGDRLFQEGLLRPHTHVASSCQLVCPSTCKISGQPLSPRSHWSNLDHAHYVKQTTCSQLIMGLNSLPKISFPFTSSFYTILGCVTIPE